MEKVKKVYRWMLSLALIAIILYSIYKIIIGEQVSNNTIIFDLIIGIEYISIVAEEIAKKLDIKIL